MYVQTLQVYYSLRNQVASGKCNKLDYNQLKWLDKTLEELEKKHQVACRWLPTDREYQELVCNLMFDKRKQLLLAIRMTGQKRLFLLQLKKKYADGQKIAKKLSIQIGKETKSVRSLVEEYHACLSTSDESNLSFDEALNPSTMAIKLENFGMWCHSVASGKKREIIDAYLMLCRSKEDMCMLKEEAENIVLYYEHRKKCIVLTLQELQSTTADCFSRGATVLLYRLLHVANTLLEQASETVRIISKETCLETWCEDEESSDMYSSDSDSDSD